MTTPKTTLKLRAKRQDILLVTVESLDCIDDEPSMRDEPYTRLQAKIEALMELTGGTEAQCERMVLEML